MSFIFSFIAFCLLWTTNASVTGTIEADCFDMGSAPLSTLLPIPALDTVRTQFENTLNTEGYVYGTHNLENDVLGTFPGSTAETFIYASPDGSNSLLDPAFPFVSRVLLRTNTNNPPGTGIFQYLQATGFSGPESLLGMYLRHSTTNPSDVIQVFYDPPVEAFAFLLRDISPFGAGTNVEFTCIPLVGPPINVQFTRCASTGALFFVRAVNLMCESLLLRGFGQDIIGLDDFTVGRQLEPPACNNTFLGDNLVIQTPEPIILDVGNTTLMDNVLRIRFRFPPRYSLFQIDFPGCGITDWSFQLVQAPVDPCTEDFIYDVRGNWSQYDPTLPDCVLSETTSHFHVAVPLTVRLFETIPGFTNGMPLTRLVEQDLLVDLLFPKTVTVNTVGDIHVYGPVDFEAALLVQQVDIVTGPVPRLHLQVVTSIQWPFQFSIGADIISNPPQASTVSVMQVPSGPCPGPTQRCLQTWEIWMELNDPQVCDFDGIYNLSLPLACRSSLSPDPCPIDTGDVSIVSMTIQTSSHCPQVQENVDVDPPVLLACENATDTVCSNSSIAYFTGDTVQFHFEVPGADATIENVTLFDVVVIAPILPSTWILMQNGVLTPLGIQVGLSFTPDSTGPPFVVPFEFTLDSSVFPIVDPVQPLLLQIEATVSITFASVAGTQSRTRRMEPSHLLYALNSLDVHRRQDNSEPSEEPENAQSQSSNAFLIGGIVSGCVLAVLGVIAYRKTKRSKPNKNSQASLESVELDYPSVSEAQEELS